MTANISNPIFYVDFSITPMVSYTALLETSHAYYARRDRLLAKQQRRAERAKLRVKLSVPPEGNVVQASQDSAPCFTFANETAALCDNDISTTLNPIVVSSSEDEDSDGEDSDSLDSSDVPPVSESDLNRDRSGADIDEDLGSEDDSRSQDSQNDSEVDSELYDTDLVDDDELRAVDSEADEEAEKRECIDDYTVIMNVELRPEDNVVKPRKPRKRKQPDSDPEREPKDLGPPEFNWTSVSFPEVLEAHFRRLQTDCAPQLHIINTLPKPRITTDIEVRLMPIRVFNQRSSDVKLKKAIKYRLEELLRPLKPSTIELALRRSQHKLVYSQAIAAILNLRILMRKVVIARMHTVLVHHIEFSVRPRTTQLVMLCEDNAQLTLEALLSACVDSEPAAGSETESNMKRLLLLIEAAVAAHNLLNNKGTSRLHRLEITDQIAKFAESLVGSVFDDLAIRWAWFRTTLAADILRSNGFVSGDTSVKYSPVNAPWIAKILETAFSIPVAPRCVSVAAEALFSHAMARRSLAEQMTNTLTDMVAARAATSVSASIFAERNRVEQFQLSLLDDYLPPAIPSRPIVPPMVVPPVLVVRPMIVAPVLPFIQRTLQSPVKLTPIRPLTEHAFPIVATPSGTLATSPYSGNRSPPIVVSDDDVEPSLLPKQPLQKQAKLEHEGLDRSSLNDTRSKLGASSSITCISAAAQAVKDSITALARASLPTFESMLVVADPPHETPNGAPCSARFALLPMDPWLADRFTEMAVENNSTPEGSDIDKGY